MKIAIVGAGQTGRGFLARLLYGQAGIAFFDRDVALIARLNARGSYAIRFFDRSPEVRISGFKAYHTQDPRVSGVLPGCDLILTSIRGENGLEAGRWIAENAPGGIPVVACENAVVPSETLGEPLSKVAGSGAIFCTTVADGPLDILSEHYPFLHVGDCSASGVLARLRGFEAEPEFDTLMARKIFTYNTASGIIAYQGAALGIESYPEAANHPEIERELDEFYREVNAAISAEYGVELGAQETFAAFSKKKFQNRAIADTVARNATSPLRKLGAEERIIAPARLIQRRGGTAGPLIRTAAAALHYLGATEASAPGVLKGTCDLVPGEPLYREILQAFLSEPYAP